MRKYADNIANCISISPEFCAPTFCPLAYRSVLGPYRAIPEPLRDSRGVGARVAPKNIPYVADKNRGGFPASSPGPRARRAEAKYDYQPREACSSPGALAPLSYPPATNSERHLFQHAPLPAFSAVHPTTLQFGVDPNIRPPLVTPPRARGTKDHSPWASTPAFSHSLHQSSGSRCRHQSPGLSGVHDPVPHGNKKRNAYEAFSSSPDGEWSTLPAKQRSKPSARSVSRDASSVNKFRLPFALPHKQTADESKLRKPLYRPPPPRPAAKDVLPGNEPTGSVLGRWKLTRVTLHDALEGLGRDLKVGKLANLEDGKSPTLLIFNHVLLMTLFINRFSVGISNRCRYAQ